MERGGGGKRAKNGPRWHKILSVSLYISGTIHHIIIKILIMISTVIFLYFFFKCNIVNIKIIFYWPTSTIFLIIICFSNSSINAKKKFWGVPHLLHMCMIFWKLLNPLCTNPTKWSETLKQFVSKSPQIVWVCLTILSGWCLRVKTQLERKTSEKDIIFTQVLQ